VERWNLEVYWGTGGNTGNVKFGGENWGRGGKVKFSGKVMVLLRKRNIGLFWRGGNDGNVKFLQNQQLEVNQYCFII